MSNFSNLNSLLIYLASLICRGSSRKSHRSCPAASWCKRSSPQLQLPPFEYSNRNSFGNGVKWRSSIHLKIYAFWKKIPREKFSIFKMKLRNWLSRVSKRLTSRNAPAAGNKNAFSCFARIKNEIEKRRRLHATWNSFDQLLLLLSDPLKEVFFVVCETINLLF